MRSWSVSPRVPPARSHARPRRPTHHLALVTGLLLVAAGAAIGGVGGEQPPAHALVVHDLGFEATVLGWSSWYGSYVVGPLGTGWCIDHGLHAPDAELVYAPTSIDGETDADTQAAMAWAATVNAPTDPIVAAATMLALHDLRRAEYPFGVLDLGGLTTANLANFHGHEGEVLERARTIRADAWAHAHLRAPFLLHLDVSTTSTGPAELTGALVATLTDGRGAPVVGVTVGVEAPGSALGPAAAQATDAAGRASFTFVRPVGAAAFRAGASIPDPHPHLWGPTTAPAQRIVQPARIDVRADASITPPTTTTTVPPTTAAPTTTTTRPASSTTTRVPTTTTTRPPTTSTSTTTSSTTTTRRTTTTRPPAPSTTRPTIPVTSTTSLPGTTTTTTPATTTTTTTTTTPATSTTTTPAVPIDTSSWAPGTPGRISVGGSLPVTGTSSRSLALAGAGLALIGVALTRAARQGRPPPTSAG